MQRVGLLVGPCYIKQAWAIVALVTFLTANNTIFIPVAAQNDPCYICGGNPEASIANPDAVISLPPDSPLPTATCSQIEAAGLAGIVTSEQCAQIQDTTGETCGCSNHVQALTGGRPGEDAIEPTPTTPTLFSTETLLPTVGQDRVVPTGTPNVEPDTPTEAPSLELVEGTQPPTFDQGLGIPTIAPVVPTLLEPPTVAPTIEEIEPTVLPTMMPIINTTTNAPVVVAVAACTASQFANDDCVDRIDSYCDVGGLCNANTDWYGSFGF